MNDFVHLHNHTCYSLLDGVSAIPELADRAQELGMSALALTDHGNLYGAIEFYQECRQRGIKPIIGCELYVAAGDSIADRVAEDRSSTHLVALAADAAGYANLLRMVTLAATTGYYRFPRVDHEILASHADGIIILSGCASSEISKLLAMGDADAAVKLARRYADWFPGRYWLELQDHAGVPQLERINEGLLEISDRLRLPLVATNDCHYVRQADSDIQDLKICIQTGTTVHDPARLRMHDDSYYLKSGAEMAAIDLFQRHPAALDNTRAVADQCDLELEFGRTRMPPPRLPDGWDADAYLARLCRDGFPSRYGTDAAAHSAPAQRLERELSVIRETGFAPYFLAVKEITDAARERGIRFGVRGSAAASITLYCLQITEIDPLEYGLVFERFLNVERKEMPDIDMDFPDEARNVMAGFVKSRYGDDHVAQIIGFNELRTRSAVRDAGRALGIPLPEVDNAARLIPRKSATLEAARAHNPRLDQLCREQPRIGDLFRQAARLSGLKRAVNKHPAGILISDEPIINISPLERSDAKGDAAGGGLLTTQYSMDQVAQLGLIKMDFLGLTSLSILDEAERLIQERHRPDFLIANLPHDDAATYALLATGNTANVFQMESEGMQQYLRELAPENIGEIAAVGALYRPGPMEHIDRYIAAKHGRAAVSYPHHSLAAVLDETYGVIVYQDQVLQIMRDYAGYSLGKADVVRKAMGKKIPELMREERINFVAGAAALGHGAETANAVFDLIEPFAGYAFNKAHAVSYAMLTYWTAYCKSNYPAEYLAAALNARRGDAAVYHRTALETLQSRSPLLPPDIVAGSIQCEITAEGAIRLGLAHVKGVSRARVENFIARREPAQSESPWETPEAVFTCGAAAELGQSAMLALAKAGAFDRLASRRAVVDGMADLWQLAQQAEQSKKAVPANQGLLLPAAGAPAPETATAVIAPDAPDATPEEKRAWENEALGFAVTPPPVTAAAATDLVALAEREHALHAVAAATAQPPTDQVKVIGWVSRWSEGATKQGKPYRRLHLNLSDGELEVMAWSETMQRAPADVWEAGAAVCAVGTLQQRRDAWSLSCQRLELAASAGAAAPLPSVAAPGAGAELRFVIDLSGDAAADRFRWRRAVRAAMHYAGDDRLVCEIRDGNRRREVVEIGAVRTQAGNAACRQAVQDAACLPS